MSIIGNIRVVVGNQPRRNVNVEASGALSPASTPVTLKNAAIGLTGGTVGAITRLDGLEDVVESAPANNATLVYDSATDKYFVKQLDLDGGLF